MDPVNIAASFTKSVNVTKSVQRSAQRSVWRPEPRRVLRMVQRCVSSSVRWTMPWAGRGCLALALVAGPAMSAPLAAQIATVQVEENFRAEPNGTILGQLTPGTVMAVETRQGGWAQVTVEGYMWERSMQILREDGFDLIISEPEGENLRDAPQGRMAGRFVRGARLQELERIPGWVRVRRTGWIWLASVQIEETSPPAPAPAPTPEPTPDPAPAQAAPPSDLVAGGDPQDWWVAGPGGLPLLTAPDGDTLGRAAPGADLRILARQGNWARVQLDGWVWIPPGDEADAGLDPEALAVEVSPGELREDPGAFRGRRVEMELQFISLERAEAIRTDFYEGEPFLLTRTAQGERSFVYVAVPPERVAEVEGLTALDRIRVTARVRTGAAAFTGNPVLELIQFTRGR